MYYLYYSQRNSGSELGPYPNEIEMWKKDAVRFSHTSFSVRLWAQLASTVSCVSWDLSWDNDSY